MAGRVFKGLFQSQMIAKLLYPGLVLMRKLLLKVNGKALINQRFNQEESNQEESNQEESNQEESNQENTKQDNSNQKTTQENSDYKEFSQTTKSINVYYNSACPVCDSGVQNFRQKLCSENIVWNDIDKDKSTIDNLNLKLKTELKTELELEFVRKRLHLVDQNGELKVGIDAFIALWEVLPKGKWKACFFRFPIIHGFSKVSYNGFAWLLYRWNRLLNHW